MGAIPKPAVLELRSPSLGRRPAAPPTRHLIHVRDADLGHQPVPLVVSIAVSDVRFA